MVHIKDIKDCCGCNVCGDVCPKQAISFKLDDEGFWYPAVDMHKCINCGLCEKVCPCLNMREPNRPLAAYAAINPDEEIRKDSSSGGIFWMLIKQTLEEGGKVFGAAFDKDWMVCHSSAVTMDSAKVFRGSKYVQSRVCGCYKAVMEALKNEKRVLFSGTACQIAALKSYLKRDYNNLITVDVVCHGVPSPGIWGEYVKTIGKSKDIKRINFRDKNKGWHNYNFSVYFNDGSALTESHKKNIYMQGFLRNLYLRPSCHDCKFKAGRCGSDITLGDFWGVEKVLPELDDNRGISIVLENTQKGEQLLKKMQHILSRVEYEKVVAGNPCLIKATPSSEYRALFMNKYHTGEGLSAISSVIKQMQPSFFKRLMYRAKKTLLHK